MSRVSPRASSLLPSDGGSIRTCPVWIDERIAKGKVGKGERGLPRMARSLGKPEGDVKNVTRSSRQQGWNPGIPVMGLHEAGADGLSWKTKPRNQR